MEVKRSRRRREDPIAVGSGALGFSRFRRDYASGRV